MKGKGTGGSTAQRVDKAFVQLCALRDKYRFPEVMEEGEVDDTWNLSYEMPHSAVYEVRRLLRIVVESLGKVPWNYAPAKQGKK